MLDKIERLKTEKLSKWARATCPDNHEWIIDHIELLRGHVAEVCLSATKQKLKLKAKTAWSVDPKELTFETYTARLGIEGEMRMMLTYLFRPTAQGAVYFVNLLDEVREVLFKSQSEDRVESKYENKTDDAAYLRQLKRDLIEIQNVPYFEGIRIHSGNTAGDSEGCPIIGDTWSGDRVMGGKLRGIEVKVTEIVRENKVSGIRIVEVR